MKHLKKFNEELTNISKNRKWPTYDDKGLSNNGELRKDTDIYFTYDLNKNDRGKYLNVWFPGNSVDNIIEPNRKRKSETHNYYDEVVTLKQTDKETSQRLYNRSYNPISIFIMKSYRGSQYDMKVHLHSIDDSSYGIWWNDKPLEELKKLKSTVMKWISAKDIINGEELLDFCVSQGADPETKDYN